MRTVLRCASACRKVFFDTLETVEKATKPSEPHSSAYRGTAECGSRRKSKCRVINSVKPIPIKNRKKNFKLQKYSSMKKCRTLTVRGVFRQSKTPHPEGCGVCFTDKSCCISVICQSCRPYAGWLSLRPEPIRSPVCPTWFRSDIHYIPSEGCKRDAHLHIQRTNR